VDHHLRVDEDAVISGPTALPTGTPALVVDNAGVGAAFEVRDAGTPVWAVNDGGSVAQTGDQAVTGDLTLTGDLSVTGAGRIAAATAVATATPALVINNAGVSQVASFQDGGTEVLGIIDGGQVVQTVPTALPTASPALVIDSSAVANSFEVRAAATPQVSIRQAGDLDIDAGEVVLDSDVFDLNDTYIDQDISTENRMLPSIVSTAITYTAAAGGSGTVATITDGEVWFVHDVFVNVTTDFDCTGDDATLVIGDGNDANGFTDLADAELQAADTEGTGFAAGWQGLIPATQGVYIDEAAGANTFIYAPSGADETIDYLIDEASGESLTAGAATIYVVYTRVQ
jgi:hypothetical protein